MCASVVWYRKDIYDNLALKVPTTWDELIANAQKGKEAGLAGFMLANQKKWPSQFMWSAILVNKHGLDVYDGLINGTIPWTDARAVDVTAMMQKLAQDGMFEPSFNSIDLGPAMVPWTQGKGLHWYQGSFNLGRFRGDQPQCCVVPMDFFPMPAFPGRKPVMSVFAEDTIMIHENSPNKDARGGVSRLDGVRRGHEQKARNRQAFPVKRQFRSVEAERDGAAPWQGDGRVWLLHFHACRPRHSASDFRQIPGRRPGCAGRCLVA